jgi:hypothetical protein
MTDEEIAKLTWTELAELIGRLLEEMTLRYMVKNEN